MMQTFERTHPWVYAKQDDGSSANPDPTMRHAKGCPKGENMPPKGGESMSPADSRRPSRPDDFGAVPDDDEIANEKSGG